MEYLVGIALALLTVAFARVVGLDRDRAFYPVVMLVVAHYYILFAAVSTEPGDVWLEVVFATVFLAAAIGGFKASQWWLVAGLAGHGVFDLAHPFFGHSHAPAAWPGFCMAYDVTAAAALAFLLRTRGVAVRWEDKSAR